MGGSGVAEKNVRVQEDSGEVGCRSDRGVQVEVGSEPILVKRRVQAGWNGGKVSGVYQRE